MPGLDLDRSSLARCELCPRRCGVNRAAGQRGFCRAGVEAEVYRYGPHGGEEPPLSGTQGSGTVFFSRCTMQCVYCQNYPWSQEGAGETVPAGRLAGIFRSLQDAGCHNLNLVSPTPWLPVLAGELAAARAAGVALPVVYNTSGYERPETLARIESGVDIYLTDLRYARETTAQEGSGVRDYVATARRALKEMWRQKGALRRDADGIARHGVICRFLVLPGHADEAAANLRWAAEEIGPDLAVSVLGQYVPAYRAAGRRPWQRRITREEYRQAAEAAEEAGFHDGWLQDFEGETAPSLIGFQMAAESGTRSR